MAVAGWSGGLYRVILNYRQSGGYITGNQTTLTANSTTQGIMFDSAVETNLAIRELTNVPIRGGDTVIGNMKFGSTGLDPFTITFSTLDPDDVALLHGTTVDSTTNTSYPMHTLYTDSTKLRGVALIMTYRLYDRDNGVNKYQHVVIPQCEIEVRRVAGNYQAADSYVWGVSPQLTTKSIHGTAFSSFGLNVANGQLDHYFYSATDYPIATTTFRANGVATTFTTAYKPASSTVTLAATPNWLTINGTATALSSINTSTGVATLAAAGSNNDYCVLVYQTELNPV